LLTTLSRVRPKAPWLATDLLTGSDCAPRTASQPGHGASRMPSKKNWAVVRRLVGYDRLELPALPALERIHDLARDYVNFLHPVRKLVSKTRSGPRITRRYDIAQTPYHRLLDSGVLSIKTTHQLKTRSKQLDPYRLKVQLEAAQRTLATRAVRSDSYVRQP
jgi:hypothetical protein